MEERELGHCVGREDVLITDVLRVIAQSLALILSGKLLVDSIRHLKVRTTKIEYAAQTVVRVKLIIKAKEPFAGAPEVMKVIERGRIEISLRRAGREVGQETEFLRVRR